MRFASFCATQNDFSGFASPAKFIRQVRHKAYFAANRRPIYITEIIAAQTVFG
jgi:hypothetical protein